ncbi:MAG TPA: choice-of-anchor D domain-containing protein [Planosporangium sp.]|nr:choice-of-anchor D domain-containing protein [Planosporangium sp.]
MRRPWSPAGRSTPEILAVPGHRHGAGPRWRLIRPALAVALLAGVFGVLQFSNSPGADADSHTVSQDTLRTGWDPVEPNLSPSSVTGSNFGQLFATKVTGQVYAQPLVIGNTVVASTEDNWAYGLDAATGAVKWSKSFGPAWPASTVGCADLTPNLGNTSTGVYDPTSNLVYLTTKVNDGPDADHPNWYLHAVDVSTGAERPGWPVRIVGTPANDPDHPFQAKDVNQRPGLLLMNGVVYLAFGGQCDYGSYVGWVAGVDTTTQAVNLWSDEVGASSRLAGIWHAGGGIVSDGPGRMFVVTGNGVTPPDSPGSPVPHQLSQSVVRLGVDASGTISSQDFFSPWNAATLDQNDQDFGAGGPVALPDQYFGTPASAHLMVQIGKEGRLYLLNRDRLGGKGQGPGATDDVVQNLGPYHGVWGSPAVYGGEGGYVYVVQSYSTMLAFKYGTNGQGAPALTLAGNSAESFGYTAGSPIVTSDGTVPGSAVVWVVNVDGPNGAGGRLCAYNGVPSNNHMTLLRCFAIGTATKFARPAAAGGRVYVGTRDGYLYGFGQPTTSALTTAQTSFGSVNVSQTGTATVKATATRAVTVTGVSTSAPFAATPPALPVTLKAGETISVPVSFSPSAPGSFTGTLKFSVTDAGTNVTVGAALQGTAVKPGFSTNPARLDFGEVPVGATKSLTVSFTNTGTANETVNAVTAPPAPFTATGLPATGTVVAPGQSVAVGVTYTPTATGASSSTVTVSGPSGAGTIPITGTGITGKAELSISPASLNFGSVPVGMSATQTLTVSNTGNLNVTVTKAAPPALPFVVNTPLPESQVLAPGDSVQVRVTFAPTAAGTYHNLYVISSDDGNGAHNVPVIGTATKPASGTPLPSVVGGGWVFNGSARMSGPNLLLTTATSQQAGSAVFSAPVPGDNLKASFTAQIGGGSGADGMTFALLDAARNTPQSLGSGGGGLGFDGLPGVAVTLDTFQAGNDPSSNFVGLSTGASNGALTYVATATNIPDLRAGAHTVQVDSAGGTVTVSIDGTQVISAAVDVPASVLPAFTGGTGGRNDQHAVSNVSVTSGSTALPRPGTGWRFNGSAAQNGAEVVLTPAQVNKAGSVLYTDPVTTDGLTASFNVTIGGGTGADGQTFSLLDPRTAPTSVGSAGGGLGFGGLAGVAVAFVTHPEGGVNSANWVGVATSTAAGTPTFVASNTTIPDLRAGSHNAIVRVVGATVTVSIDGTQVISVQVPSLTPTAIVGYTAATGGATDVHAVSNAQIIPGTARPQPQPRPTGGPTATRQPQPRPTGGPAATRQPQPRPTR